MLRVAQNTETVGEKTFGLLLGSAPTDEGKNIGLLNTRPTVKTKVNRSELAQKNKDEFPSPHVSVLKMT